MTVNILGTAYTIERAKPWEDAGLSNADGYCDDSVKKIVVSDEIHTRADTKENLDAVRNKQLRHEILHAFLFESGLAENSDWAQKEEAVDWFAIQGMQIYAAWFEAGAVDAHESIAIDGKRDSQQDGMMLFIDTRKGGSGA